MIVIKIGGGGGLDLAACLDDVARLRAEGREIVVVHGGSGPATELGEALGYPPQFITTPSGMRSRYTDARTLEIFTMALARFNTELVASLQTKEVQAVGLSGVDGRVLEGRRKETVVAVEDGRRRVIRDDRSGTVEGVNTGLLRTLLDAGYVPVLSPPAWSPDGPINVDGDRAAAQVARALDAHTLVLLTNVPGLLRACDDEGSLIQRVGPADWDEALLFANGRMRIKLLAARAALDGGVPRVVIADGRREQPIIRALAGKGTVLGHEQPDPEGPWQGTNPEGSTKDLLHAETFQGPVPAMRFQAQAPRERL